MLAVAGAFGFLELQARPGRFQPQPRPLVLRLALEHALVELPGRVGLARREVLARFAQDPVAAALARGQGQAGDEPGQREQNPATRAIRRARPAGRFGGAASLTPFSQAVSSSAKASADGGRRAGFFSSARRHSVSSGRFSARPAVAGATAEGGSGASHMILDKVVSRSPPRNGGRPTSAS